MYSILDKINLLQRDEIIESALSVSAIITNGAGHADPDPENTLRLSHNPYDDILEVEKLARIVLINAAASSDVNRQLVDKVIEASGKKNFILSGGEIVALATIGLLALRILVNPKTNETIKYTDEKGEKIEIKRDYAAKDNTISAIIKKWLK